MTDVHFASNRTILTESQDLHFHQSVHHWTYQLKMTYTSKSIPKTPQQSPHQKLQLYHAIIN